MRSRCLFLLLFLSGLMSRELPGQVLREFSPDSLEFPGQFHEYMERYLSEDEMTDVEDFITFYRSSDRDVAWRRNIHQIFNALLEKRGRPKPHFHTLLRIMSEFRQGTTGEHNRLAWEAGFQWALQNPSLSLRDVEQFLENSLALLTDGMLNRSRSVVWKATSPDFRMDFSDTLAILFDETDLICYAQRDSTMITGTRGRYDPFSLIWTGSKGKVTWERAGFHPDSVYALLDACTIDMSRAEYTADSVLFHHLEYFDTPLMGVLHEKTKNIISPERATHPQFDSYVRRMFVKNLYDNIDFDGGFSMQGARLNGSGGDRSPATIYIYRQDTLVLKALSDFFVFRKDRVNSSNTEITIYMGKDSIFHPEIYFTFGIGKRELSLLRTDNIMTRSPYFNSLHEVDMTFEQLAWKIDEPVIKMTMAPGSAMGQASFRSVNYFKENHYRRLQGIDLNNPLAVINRFAEWYYSEQFPVQELANWMKMPVEQVQQTVILLATEGFLYYDPETSEVTIKEKLHNYLDSHSGRIDYDVILINSEVRSPDINASLDLRTSDLTINGVGAIFLSDSQNVALVPSGTNIILQENRNFLFDGRVEAGLFTFYGHQFHFDYDSFRISMPAIDSIALRLEERNPQTGLVQITEVKNRIEVASGELDIDRPDNKSGRISSREYPIFSTDKKAFVYYHGKIPGDTTGLREEGIRFEINPFTIRELDHFTREDVVFDGDFESKGILPAFPQTLRMQEDYSLGFTHEVPEEGFPLYGGKGIFYDHVKMSNEGLRGSGKMIHQNTTLHSDEFMFYPDSMVTVASRFEMSSRNQDEGMPEIRSESVNIRWYPGEDRFLALSGTSPFDMYAGKARLTGTLTLTPGNLAGNGVLALDRIRLSSKNYHFYSRRFQSDSMGFHMFSPDGSRKILETENFNAAVSLSQNQGIFRSNELMQEVSFPVNRFISYTNYMEWDIEKEEWLLDNRPSGRSAADPLLTAERDKKINWLISTHPQQDSLAFRAATTRFDARNNILHAEGVDQIEVADALLIPENREVTVEANAHIKTLRNTEIHVLSGELKHRIYEASVDILGRKEYFGSGKYDYVDRDGNSQIIVMDDIKVDTAYHTVAEGSVTEDSPLMLDPYFEFAGKVTLEAGSEYLTFSGGARPQYDCPDIARNFIGFTSKIDPADVLIPVPPEPRAMNNVKIYTGHFITNDSIHIYPAFFSGRKNYSDIPISSASGYLWFDEESGEYRVGSLEKRANPELAESLIRFDRNYCRLHGEGKLDLGIDLGQLKLSAYGEITTDLETGETELDVMLGLNFFFAEDALNTMYSDIRSIPTLPPLDMNSQTVMKQFTHLLGKTESGKVMEQLSLYGVLNNVPEQMNFSLMLPHVKLRWDQAANSYRSEGKIGIGNILQTPLNVMVDGHIEIQKRRSGDMMDIYLDVESGTYYYFGYTRGVMQSISSNNAYRDILTGLNVKQRTLNTRGNETPYIYMIAVDRKMDMFLRRIRRSEAAEEETIPDTF